MLLYFRGIVTFFFMQTINLIVPKGWHELDDKQLRYLFGLLADDYSSAEVRTLCLFCWSGLKVHYRHNSYFVVRPGKREFTLSATQVAEAIETMKWLDEIPSFPVRLSHIGQSTALPADFLSVPFEKYIYCDNLYQGYLHTKNDSLIDEMMKVLYPDCNSKGLSLEGISIFYWFASLKQYFAKTFNHFFQQPSGSDSNQLSALLICHYAPVRAS